MKIKVSELQGTALDWAVAKCEGVRLSGASLQLQVARNGTVSTGSYAYPPSSDWSLAGPIIEREWLCVDRMLNGEWLATKRNEDGDSMLFARSGRTPLIAAMRCYVASKMGDEIEVPDELQ